MPDRSRARRVPRWNSLVAAAQVMTAPNVNLRRAGFHRPTGWQADAWDYYDSIGELRFAAAWISNAMSRVNLIAAAGPAAPGDEPTPIDPANPEFTPVQRRAAELVATIAGGVSTQGQILASFGTHLTIAGLCWLVIEPDSADANSDRYTDWFVYSSDEIRLATDGSGIEIRAAEREWRPIHEDAVVIKVWRRHPRWSWEADSPTHGVLSVLREIDLLSKHITASAQSRLAGAGLLALPSEAVFPPGQGPQSSTALDPSHENVTPPEDTFVDTLVDAMTVPIVDRGSAAAVVPLVVKIPGEHVDKIRHISFATPFDDKVMELLDGAIRRLALGLDLPPEILTGTSGMNHWGAWQVAEEAITLHIEPLSEVVTNAFTIGYLKPALLAEGYSSAEADTAMVWYDTTDLRARPDKSTAAREAYDRGELSSAALLREMGLSIQDMPSEEEKRERILLQVAKGAPTLAPAMLAELGYLEPAKIGEAQGTIDATAAEITSTPVSETPPPGEPTQGPPETGGPGEEGDVPDAPSDGLSAACFVLMHRAMERAGSRLRSAAGRATPGGAASVACSDPARLHVDIDALAISAPESLLEGAWSLAPEIAARFGVEPRRLILALDDYARSLLADRRPLDYDDLRTRLAVYSSAD